MKVLEGLNRWCLDSEDDRTDIGLYGLPFKVKNEKYVTFNYFDYNKKDVKKSLRQDRIETDKYLLEFISPILIKHNIYQFNTVDTPNNDSRTQIWKYNSDGKWFTNIGQLKFDF
ncbi:hypothetical protein COB55_06025 [Candidatus Wolfebacteria bacterium]|nr:MAG: hypothetical protein COB55_06025 [Candidatus Wolfebacteria bacterium]